MEKLEEAKFRILVFPYLSFSHVYPFFELAKRLSNRNFHIYFCSSAINLESIKKTMQKSISDSSIQLVELDVPSLPQLPPDLHTTKNLPPNLTSALMQAFQMSSSSFSGIFNNLKPDLVIYDFFQPWVPKLASSQGIPSVYFATAGAAPFSYFHHLYTYGSTSTFPFQEIYLLDREKAELNALVKPEIKDADQDFSFGIFRMSREIVLVKGCKGFDGKYMDHLSVLCQKKVVPTGLLVDDSKEDEGNLDILQWLSKKERFSTLFICFGSEHFLSKDQIQEISKGLELCDVNFIWVIKFSFEDKRVTLEEALPRGFLKRVNGRGMVVEGWVPQAKILSNPNIGAFASHCGWGSVTESLYYNVPVIAMPCRYDQPINARLVVEAGVGVEVVKCQNGLFTGEEIAKAVRKVFAERSGEDMRFKAWKLSEKIKKEEEQEVDEVAEQILRLCLKNK
ncbi:mogroside IIIx synthase-like [Primulina eburnea]|uniref:mogroside IIIx synthase-like n=1 Tax=Primulina eburnea TaxID=1245227 RepID=UPI003C6C96BF